jgi:capsid protein
MNESSRWVFDCLPGFAAGFSVGGIAENEIRNAARSWDAAETNRLNDAHWENASYDVLTDLAMDLPEIQRRTRHEAINNSLIDGAIETQQTNVVSARGPALQVLTDDDKFNDEAEALFSAWSESCEYQDDLALVDLLEGWVAQWIIYGEILVREIVGQSVADYRLFDMGAEAFDHYAQSANVHSGVECDAAGRVVRYHVCDPQNPAAKQTLPKEFCLHVYRRRFAMQRRGYPGLASVLEPAGELRDYDAQVNDAARAAADQAVFFVSNHADADFVEPANKVLPWRRRMRQYVTPGWDMRALPAHQPAATYTSYRKERHTDVGNALEMPWMILRKDASQHNMSSARFDGSRYAKSILRFQSRIERRALCPVVRRLFRIAQMEGVLRPTPANPKRDLLRFDFPNSALQLAFTWPKPPAVDHYKDALAERTKLENGTLSLSEAIADDGRRPDETIRIRTRDNAALLAAGLPPIMGAIPSQLTPAELAAAINPDEPTPQTPALDSQTELDQ